MLTAFLYRGIYFIWLAISAAASLLLGLAKQCAASAACAAGELLGSKTKCSTFVTPSTQNNHRYLNYAINGEVYTLNLHKSCSYKIVIYYS